MSADMGFRKAKDGRITGFVYYDKSKQKNVRIGAESGWPDNVYADHDAKSERSRILGRIDASLLDAKKRLDWINKYQKFDQLFEEFETWVKKRAPNSWQSSMSNLKNYTMFWFLQQRSLSNPELWPRHFNDFTEWLLSERPLKISKGKLSKNTVNNIIKATNSFLRFLEKQHFLGPFIQLEEVRVGKSERRGLESIFSEEDQNLVEQRLGQIDPRFGVIFRLLCKSGMRVNEALGLHIGSLVFKRIPEEEAALFRRFQDARIPYFGFILLKDQPSLDSIFDSQGKVPRKSLKGRREIAPQFNRCIPIIDRDLALAMKELKASARGSAKQSPEDQLLFGVTYRQFYTAFYRVRAELKLRSKNIHSARHTFSTWITRKMGGDRTVSEKVLGHSSADVNKRYQHLAQELEVKLQSAIEEDDCEITQLKVE